MSVKFQIENDHIIEEVHDCECAIGVPDCELCSGTGTLTTSYGKHEVRISKFNTSNILPLIDPDGNHTTLCGSWQVQDIPRIRNNITKALSNTHPATQKRLQNLLTLINMADIMATPVTYC